ncbi:hypothetical protein GCT13_15920 [Paraburkholderia sp. CNPSo 3157]|uniref:Uncharacterized protein n=1 Tax=Paraburkholderia franconis TaxID=2654983 RepID=A0A7X1TGM6_9BURK|nr:hypothetical protein [Paraburkholderia franconis]MPW18359.1 hypothetical protein [Paraburkholderia franconis]
MNLIFWRQTLTPAQFDLGPWLVEPPAFDAASLRLAAIEATNVRTTPLPREKSASSAGRGIDMSTARPPSGDPQENQRDHRNARRQA